MGSVLAPCVVSNDYKDTKVKLQKAEQYNQTLREELLETRKKYDKLKLQTKSVEEEKIRESTAKTNVSRQYQKEKEEKHRLTDRYNKQNNRLSLQQSENTKLQMQNARLMEELDVAKKKYTELSEQEEPSSASESNAVDATDDEEKDASPRTDMVKLRNFLVYKQLSSKDLATELTKLLSNRSVAHRCQIPEAYRQRYGSDILEDISKVLKKKGVLDNHHRNDVFELVDGLLRAPAECDALCIKDVVASHSAKAASTEIACILCCRTPEEIQAIDHEYKRMFGASMRDKVYSLHTKTYQTVINMLFTFSLSSPSSEKETLDENQIREKIESDVQYLLDKTIKWKQFDKKVQLMRVIMTNNRRYVLALTKQFFQQSGGTPLVSWLEEQLGEKSVSGTWARTRVEYCLNSDDFYANRLRYLGEHWSKGRNHKDINHIFISRFDGHLKNIQSKFNELNYGNGKSMQEWVDKKCSDQYAEFLIKMLENCHKF